MFSHLHSKKKGSPDVQRVPPVFNFCPFPLVLPQDTTEKILALSSLDTPFRCFYLHVIPQELSILQVEQSQYAQPFLTGEMLLSLNYLCVLSLNSLYCVHVCFALGSPEPDAVHQVGLSTANGGERSSIRLLCCKDTLVAHARPSTHQDPPRSFSASWVASSMYWFMVIFLLGKGFFTFLSDFHELPFYLLISPAF